MKNYEQALFAYHFINLKKGHSKTELPFLLGGATRQGWSHRQQDTNNQDAVSISIDNDIMIGVVCDGCTSTHDKLKIRRSNNEIGSKLISRM